MPTASLPLLFESSTLAPAAVLAAVALAFGWLIGARRSRRARREAHALRLTLAEERARHDAAVEKLAWTERRQAEMHERFRGVAAEVLEQSRDDATRRTDERLDRLLSPMSRTLAELDRQVRGLETTRRGAYDGLLREIELLRDAHRLLREEAQGLRRALGAPGARGRWGEVQLRRLVEMAGMAPNVDFVEQAAGRSGTRPDLVVRLADGGCLPIDAKTPLGDYLRLAGADDAAERRGILDAHARALRRRMLELAAKEYWRELEGAPDFVVMFLPHDGALAAAFERDPDFFDHAVARRVLPATPVTLLALLKSVALGWRQHRLAEGAARIADTGRELHARLGPFVDHLRRLGDHLGGSVEAYNGAIGSMERRLLPVLRRLEDDAATATRLEPPAR
ncbi:MAG: DNA recombination protein RmuC, partial [Acidobacteriota bacterium]